MARKNNSIPSLNIGSSLRKGLSLKIIDERAKNHPLIYDPHRDNHYMIILAFNGSYNMMVDFEKRSSAGPSVAIILPGQVHQLLDTESPEGIAIDFDPLFITKEFENLFYNQPAIPRITALHSDYLIVFREIAELLYKAFCNTSKYSEDFVHSLFNSLQVLIKDLLSAGYPQIPHSNKSRIISNEFTLLLKQNFSTWKRPAQYADALFISPGYLNEAVKLETGKSVSTLIQETSILEAKRVLFFTEKGVKAISYEVGYEDPAYFSRLFKKLSGVTPLDFRNEIRDQSYRNTE